MDTRACAFCGIQTEKLLDVFPDARVGEKRPFCQVCLEAGAPAIHFEMLADPVRATMQSLCRLSHRLIEELGGLRRELDELKRGDSAPPDLAA